MIYFLVTRRNQHTIQNFLKSGDRRFCGRVKIILWENIKTLRHIQAGTFIFSDLDMLTPLQREVAAEIYQQLSSNYAHLTLLNNPNKVLLRYELLKKMYQLGINRFKAVLATEAFDSLRFPVFVRETNRHTGSLTSLIHSVEELHKHIWVLDFLGYPLKDLLVIEYLKASIADGVYMKHSAFILGNRVMPRYLNYSYHWMMKSSIAAGDALMESKKDEVEAFMRNNPHNDWLLKNFQISGISYGRADYSIVNGELQLWEINLNPAFILPPREPEKDNNQQRMMRNMFYKQFFDEMERIDYQGNDIVNLGISESQLAKMKTTFAFRINEWFRRRLVKKKLRYRIMRATSYAIAYSFLRLRFKS